jgi:hypothetical protein
MDRPSLQNASNNASHKPALTGPSSSTASTAASTQRAKRIKSVKPNKKLALWALLGLIALALAGGGIYAYTKYQNVKEENNKLTSNPQEAVKKEQENLIKSVGALTDLPSGEAPTIATVSDASKLKSQAFFANAENGDRVLIYTNAKKAYLYRPSTNKVINIAPVNIGNNNESTNTESNQ